MKKILLSITATLLSATALAQIPAFPGAEGHGRYTTGGRATDGTTKVYHVTTLEDNTSGNIEGSLRWALKQSGPRTIVFDVAGIIELKANLNIPANTTIAGQTAPKPGITLRYYTVTPTGSNIIMRFIRIRRGEEKDVNDGADATWCKGQSNLLLDHCSFSWSIDEIASYYDNRDFTMQWCTLGEALANPGHSKGEHSYGGIWGGKQTSFHHNMIIHVQNRAPRLCGARYGWQGYDKTKYKNTIEAEIVDLRNCVMYNWGQGNGAYAGMGGYHNIVNNYYKAGPATKNKTRVFQCGHTTGKDADGGSAIDPDKKGIYGHFYIDGNYVTAAGNNAANYDWKGVIVDDDHDNVVRDSIKLTAPVITGEVTTHTAEKAFEKVLDYCGASLYRDVVDKRYMNEAKNGTTTYTGSAEKAGDGSSITHYPGIIDKVADQGTYTLDYTKRSATFDADKDGMADEWEQLNGGDLDPNAYTLDSQKQWYSNLEVYLNSLVEDIMKAGNADASTAVNEYYPACEKLPVEDDPEPSVNSSIKWDFSTGESNQTATLSGTAETGIESATITLGYELTYGTGADPTKNKTLTAGGYKETLIWQKEINTSAADGNAITFSIKPKNGYTLKATSVSFTATRNGTDKGKIDAKWIDGNGTTLLCKGVTPKRNSTPSGKPDESPFFTTYTQELDGNATSGEAKLVINLYDLAFLDSNKNNVLTPKSFGFCNIAIEGIMSNASGISTPVTMSMPMDNTYYNIKGQRVAKPTKGLYIVNGKKVIIK